MRRERRCAAKTDARRDELDAADNKILGFADMSNGYNPSDNIFTYESRGGRTPDIGKMLAYAFRMLKCQPTLLCV